ncbi:MAG: hypothetical protein HY007_04290 [Candidatus Sungbacteria bacterium]|nr:hypothetical protein [Candidatus Sungbacteria bacterium]
MNDEMNLVILSSPLAVGTQIQWQYMNYFNHVPQISDDTEERNEERAEKLANLFLLDGTLLFNGMIYKSRTAIKALYVSLSTDEYHNGQRRYCRRIVFSEPMHTRCEFYPTARIIHQVVGRWQRIYDSENTMAIEERQRPHIFVIAGQRIAQDPHIISWQGIRQLIIGEPFQTQFLLVP